MTTAAIAPAVLAAYQAGRGLASPVTTHPRIGAARRATLEAIATPGRVSYMPGIHHGQGYTFRRFEAGRFRLCTKTAAWAVDEGLAQIDDPREPGQVTLTLAGELALGRVTPLTPAELDAAIRTLRQALEALGSSGQRSAGSLYWALRGADGTALVPTLERVINWTKGTKSVRDQALRIAAELVAFWGHTRTAA